MKPELIVALDVNNLTKAEKFVDLLYPKVKIFKIGSQLFTLYGPQAVELVQRKGAKVFLDLKFYDIPNTVANASAAATRLGVFMFNLHAQGGPEMMRAAGEARDKEAAKSGTKPPLLIAVTLLTSQAKNSKILPLVLNFTRSAKESGLDGVVASVNETAAIRKKFGKDLIIVTPGIRPRGAATGDQKRVATAGEAIKAGSNFLVVGRSILEAKNPLKAAEEILREI